MTQKPDVTVIIVNWNTKEYLRACLRSLPGGASGLSLQVVVVDNASGDGSTEMVRLDFPDVEVLESKENLGFARGNNLALARARGRYVFLLNPDTELTPGALAEMVEYMEAHPETGVVGPRLNLPRGGIQGGAAGYDPSPSTVFNYSTFLYSIFPGRLRGLWLPKSMYLGDGPVEADWVSGAAMLVRMEAVKQVGPMDGSLFMYAEDVEWCRRIRRAGWRVMVLPSVGVLHHVGRSSVQREADFYSQYVDSWDHYYREQYGWFDRFLLHLFGAFGFFVRFLWYAIMNMLHPSPTYRELRNRWRVIVKSSARRLLALFMEVPGNQVVMRLTKNTVSLSAKSVLRAFTGLVLSIYVARVFGARGMGQFAILLAFINIFQILSEFGIPRLVTRELARRPEETGQYLWSSLIVMLAFSTIGMVLLILTARLFHYPPDTQRILAWSTFTLPGYILFAAAGSVVQARERMEFITLAEGLSAATQLTLAVLLFKPGADILALAWVKDAGFAVLGLTMLGVVIAQGKLGSFRWGWGFSWRMVRESTDIFVMNFLSAILFRLDVLTLSLLVGEWATGIYNAAYQVVKLLIMFSQSFADAIFPILSRYFKESKARFAQALRQTTAVSVGVGLLASIAVAAVAAPLIHILYGKPEYAASVGLLRILVWAFVPYLVFIIFLRALVAADSQEKARQAVVFQVIASAAYLGALTWLAGATGTAIGIVLSFATGAALNAFEMVRIGVKFW